MERFYTPENLVFFSMGRMAFKRIVRMAEKLLPGISPRPAAHNRVAPGEVRPVTCQMQKETHQAHVLMGARAYSMYSPKRLPLFLLNNLLGGTGMNNRLNVSLREKHGLVYNVEKPGQGHFVGTKRAEEIARCQTDDYSIGGLQKTADRSVGRIER